MAIKQRTAVDTYVVPRVNLLPPEIAAKRAERRSYIAMGLTVAAAVTAVAVLYVGQAAKVSAAEADLAAAQRENTQLDGDRARLQSVQAVYLAVDADEALLSRAYENRVFFSVYLHNISIGIPDNVWVTQFTGTVVAAAPSQKITTQPTVGTLTFSGKAFEYNDLAAWLESNARLKGVTNTSFSTAAKVKPTTPGARTLVAFSSTASLTPAAITPHTKPRSR